MDISIFRLLFKNKVLKNIVFQEIIDIHKSLKLKSYKWRTLLDNSNLLICYNYFYHFRVNVKWQYRRINNLYTKKHMAVLKEYIELSFQYGRVNFIEFFVSELNLQLDRFITVPIMIKYATNNGIPMLEYLCKLTEQSKLTVEKSDYMPALIDAIDRLDVFIWLHEKINKASTPYDHTVFITACAHGNIEMVNWIITNRPIDSLLNVETDTSPQPLPSKRFILQQSLKAALKQSQIHVADWLFENYKLCLPPTTLINLYDIASETHDNVDSIIWTKQHMKLSIGNDTKTIMNFAKHGHFKSFREVEYILEGNLHREVFDMMCLNGHLELVQYIHEKFPNITVTSWAMDCAAINGHLDIINWLHANRTEGCTTFAMDQAAKKGHLEIVKWLHTNRTEGCTTQALNNAMDNNDIEMVKFLTSNRTEGCSISVLDRHIEYQNTKIVSLVLPSTIR